MASLNESLKEIIAKNHPSISSDKLIEGENILHEDADGTKFFAHLKNGKITFAVNDIAGNGGTLVHIQPPPPADPNHVLVCMSYPISTGRGEGVLCWWAPIER